MALGSLTVGSPHSSAIEEIMPMAEKLEVSRVSTRRLSFNSGSTDVYADGRRPIKKEKLPQPDIVGSKWP
jgi:hypothetical protein